MLTSTAVVQGSGNALATVAGRGIAHLTIFLPALALYFIILPRVYGFSTLGNPLQVFALASAFVLATSFMAQAVGAWFKRPESPILLFLATSLPQFFVTGVSWPREALPAPLLAAGRIFPSELAIDGLVRVDQLGANLWEVARDWRGLWLLAFIYFAFAVLSAYLVRRRQANG
jgi:ABC-2 type transport system permease protein